MSDRSDATGAIPDEIPDCPRCGKPLPLCICESVEPIQNKVQLLILQHPQEQDRALGTARLAALHFRDAVVKIGLSWPSLSKALGRTVHDPSRWAILYLGSAKVADLDTDKEIVAIDRKGELEEHQRAILEDIEGIVLLDGTWSQAKALWWRNAWMLKCQRVILGPKRASRYGGGGPAAGRARKAAGYRRDAQCQFRADAGPLPRSAGRNAGARPQAEKEGLSRLQGPEGHQEGREKGRQTGQIGLR